MMTMLSLARRQRLLVRQQLWGHALMSCTQRCRGVAFSQARQAGEEGCNRDLWIVPRRGREAAVHCLQEDVVLQSELPGGCGPIRTLCTSRRSCGPAATKQKSDWRFHKRVCKKPAAKKKDAPKKPKTGGDAKAAAAAPAPAAATKPKPKKSADSGPTQAELDAEDEEIVKSLKSYGYFHRDANARRQVLNDLDTTPELLESKQADSDDPQPVKASNLTSTSAWNTAGTWEERNMTSWAKSRLEELLVGLTQEVTDGHIELKEVTDWEGDASIPVIRGRPRFLYDFTFKVCYRGVHACRVLAVLTLGVVLMIHRRSLTYCRWGLARPRRSR